MKNILWILALLVLMLVAAWIYTSLKSGEPQAGPEPETATVLIYLARATETDIEFVAVEREVPAADAVDELARSAIAALLVGPTTAEAESGLSVPFNEGTIVNAVTIADATITADFNDQFDFQLGGSARVMAIRQSIERTLRQFVPNESVEIRLTVNHGEREAVLEP